MERSGGRAGGSPGLCPGWTDARGTVRLCVISLPQPEELPRSMSDLKIPQGQESAQEILKEIAPNGRRTRKRLTRGEKMWTEVQGMDSMHKGRLDWGLGVWKHCYPKSSPGNWSYLALRGSLGMGTQLHRFSKCGLWTSGSPEVPFRGLQGQNHFRYNSKMSFPFSLC